MAVGRRRRRRPCVLAWRTSFPVWRSAARRRTRRPARGGSIPWYCHPVSPWTARVRRSPPSTGTAVRSVSLRRGRSTSTISGQRASSSSRRRNEGPRATGRADFPLSAATPFESPSTPQHVSFQDARTDTIGSTFEIDPAVRQRMSRYRPRALLRTLPTWVSIPAFRSARMARRSPSAPMRPTWSRSIATDPSTSSSVISSRARRGASASVRPGQKPMATAPIRR